MENAPFALAGSVSAAGSLDRAPRKPGPWVSRDRTERRQKINVLSGKVAETMTVHDKPPPPAGFTLRVKPDRRRVQLPIPADSIAVVHC